MLSLFPTQLALQKTFGSQGREIKAQSTTPSTSSATPRQAHPELFSAAFSVIDDSKKKLSAEAQKEFDKAKTGNIELYSSGFYAAATFGGLMACVGAHYLLSFL